MKVSWMEDGGGNGDDWGGYERTGSHASEIDAMGTLENMLAESALWLGLVEVGLTPGRRNEANLSHVRLTEWGHFFLTDGRGEFPALGQNPVEHTFKLLPNLEIVLPPRLQAAGQATLFRVAVLKSPHAFVLTKASLCEALDGGMTKEEILRFLEVSSQTGLPASVRQAVEEWAASHGRIKVGEAGIYVEADDPLLFVELQSHKAFRDILVKPLGDRVALVSGGDPERVLRLLRKLGYFSVHDKPVPPSNR